MKPMKIAILGFGKIAEDQHVPSIAANPRFELVATSSRSGQGVAPIYADWRELIRSVEGLDAVAITTPPGPRYDIARECVLAGLHCLLEKPPAAGLTQIHDLACLAETEQVSLFTTWHAQNNPAVDEATRLLAGKRIKSMAVRWHENVHKWHPGQTWIFEAGGFGVFDPGINAFSVITRIFPGAVFVRDAELQVPANAQAPIAAKIQLASPAADGSLDVSFDFRWSDEEEWTIDIATADGLELRLERGGARLSVGGVEQACEGPGEYPDIYRHFADLIDGRRSHVDVAPLRLVADSLLIGRTTQVEPIHM
jgi:D-galactose 1-dehydrogenase